MEFLERACDAGLHEGCYRLGTIYESGMDVPKDTARADSLFEKACEPGEAVEKACFKTGARYEKAGDVERALRTYEHGCTSESLFRPHSRLLVSPSCIASRRLLASGCVKGDAETCWKTGEAWAYAKDKTQAAKYLELACSKGHKCVQLGTDYLAGVRVAKNFSRAAKLFAEACSNDDPRGCELSGATFASGIGVPKDLRRGARLFEKACSMDDAVGCEHLCVALKQIDSSSGEAKCIPLRQKACSLGHKDSCVAK
jgi:TPR repeat protein